MPTFEKGTTLYVKSGKFGGNAGVAIESTESGHCRIKDCMHHEYQTKSKNFIQIDTDIGPRVDPACIAVGPLDDATEQLVQQQISLGFEWALQKRMGYSRTVGIADTVLWKRLGVKKKNREHPTESERFGGWMDSTKMENQALRLTFQLAVDWAIMYRVAPSYLENVVDELIQRHTERLLRPDLGYSTTSESDYESNTDNEGDPDLLEMYIERG